MRIELSEREWSVVMPVMSMTRMSRRMTISLELIDIGRCRLAAEISDQAAGRGRTGTAACGLFAKPLGPDFGQNDISFPPGLA